MKNGGEQWDLVGIKECEGEWGTWGSSGMEANVDGERPGCGVSWWTRQPPEQVLAGRGQVTGPGPLGDLPVRHHQPEPSPMVPDDLWFPMTLGCTYRKGPVQRPRCPLMSLREQPQPCRRTPLPTEEPHLSKETRSSSWAIWGSLISSEDLPMHVLVQKAKPSSSRFLPRPPEQLSPKVVIGDRAR